jgi:predicted nuclease with TOPRIM domain
LPIDTVGAEVLRPRYTFLMEETTEHDPLIAANARLDAEAEALKAENEELRQILARKRALVERLRALVPEVESEKAAIDSAFSRLVSRTS